jgi:hypothetical protein
MKIWPLGSVAVSILAFAACGSSNGSGGHPTTSSPASSGTSTGGMKTTGSTTNTGTGGNPNTCPGSEQMCAGKCVDTQLDQDNCGMCNQKCSSGDTCRLGSCMAVSPGAACMVDTDCGGTGRCDPAAAGWSGGYCLYPCATAADCGPGGVCYPFGSTNLCLAKCATVNDCRNGYACIQGPMASNVCYPACDTSPALLCAPNACSSVDPTICNGVISAYACSQNTDCSTGSVCTNNKCKCTPSTNCGAGQTCYPSAGTCGCATDAVCGTGHTCNQTTGQCL